MNSRTIVAPVAAFTMACILFVYTRTSIRAAKENAQRHRDADSGGQGVSLLNEHRRRHGQAEKMEAEKGTIRELVGELREEVFGRKKKDGGDDVVGAVSTGRIEEEQRLRALKGRVGRRKGGDDAG